MNPSTIATLILAGIAVLGSIGSVTLLAARIGRLIGITETHIHVSEDDRKRIWQEIGAIKAHADRHVEVYHGGHRVS